MCSQPCNTSDFAYAGVRLFNVSYDSGMVEWSEYDSFEPGSRFGLVKEYEKNEKDVYMGNCWILVAGVCISCTGNGSGPSDKHPDKKRLCVL